MKNEGCKACLLSGEIDFRSVVSLDGLLLREEILSPLKNNISHYVLFAFSVFDL